MRTKAVPAVLCILLTLIFSAGFVPLRAAGYEYTADEVDELIGGIVDYKLDEAGAYSIDDWISGGLSAGAGVSSEWYAVALAQSGYSELSAYESSLRKYIESNNITSAVERERYAIALIASGSRNSYISDILDESIAQQGIMSIVYGLHILNNDYECSRFTVDTVVNTLLAMQKGDGGWALSGENGDVDVTAMTIQSLAPHYPYSIDVQNAVERGLDFLSQKQQPDGGYKSFGIANPESAAQVLTALSSLDIDCRYDERFIKDGNTVIDGIVKYRLPDGSFSHTEGGGMNDNATSQAYYSLVAFRRMLGGQSPLYIFDNRQPLGEQASQEQVTAADTTEKAGTPSGTAATSAVHTTLTATTVIIASGTSKTVSEVKSEAVMTGASSESDPAAVPEKAKIQREAAGKKGYKAKAVIIIVCAGAVLSLIVFVLGKRSYKNFIVIGAAVLFAIAAVLFIDISSADEYYSGEVKDKENVTGTVTLEIRCDTIAGKTDSEYIPDDGVILKAAEFDIEAGDTVFDILTEAAQTYGIHIEYSGSSASAAYVSGINNIYEFDFGDLSGWVFHVNGKTSSVGCGEYVLSDGDEVEWLYSCELGHDLGEEIE